MITIWETSMVQRGEGPSHVILANEPYGGMLRWVLLFVVIDDKNPLQRCIQVICL